MLRKLIQVVCQAASSRVGRDHEVVTYISTASAYSNSAYTLLHKYRLKEIYSPHTPAPSLSPLPLQR
jgi:hypothetical protein